MPAKQVLNVVRGGRYAKMREATSGTVDFSLDREMVTAFVLLHTPDGTMPSGAIEDIRRGRQKPWRYLARRIREARAQLVPKEQVRELVRVLDDYIERVYTDVPRKAA